MQPHGQRFALFDTRVAIVREHRDTIYVCTFVRHLLSGDISCILEQWGSTVARSRTKSAARYVGRLVRKKRKKRKRKEEERNCQLRSQRSILLFSQMRLWYYLVEDRFTGDLTFWKVRMFYGRIGIRWEYRYLG